MEISSRGKIILTPYWWLSNGLALDIFKVIVFYENCHSIIQILLNYVPKDPINDNPTLVRTMAWCWPGNMPLSEPIMA